MELETIADIVAYMKQQAETWAKNGEPVERCDNYAILADRIDEAHNRECAKLQSKATEYEFIELERLYKEEVELSNQKTRDIGRLLDQIAELKQKLEVAQKGE